MNAELIYALARKVDPVAWADLDKERKAFPADPLSRFLSAPSIQQSIATVKAALQAIHDEGQAIVPNGVVDALATAEAWLEAWGSHVGGCDGGSRCTCGLEAVKAEIGHAIYQAHQPKTGEGT